MNNDIRQKNIKIAELNNLIAFLKHTVRYRLKADLELNSHFTHNFTDAEYGFNLFIYFYRNDYIRGFLKIYTLGASDQYLTDFKDLKSGLLSLIDQIENEIKQL